MTHWEVVYAFTIDRPSGGHTEHSIAVVSLAATVSKRDMLDVLHQYRIFNPDLDLQLWQRFKGNPKRDRRIE